MGRKVKREDVINKLRDIAFGRSNDIVKLAFIEGENELDRLDDLDLTMLSEVKRSANGAVELKLANRIDVLKLLLNELGGGESTDNLGAQSFFAAIDKAASNDDNQNI